MVIIIVLPVSDFQTRQFSVCYRALDLMLVQRRKLVIIIIVINYNYYYYYYYCS